MATKNYQKMFEEAKKAKDEFFNKHWDVLEEYKSLVRECGNAKREITEVRKAKRREVIHYILDHDKEFTPSDLFRLCNCENCYSNPGRLGAAIELELVPHYYKKINRRVRTITRKYVEVDDNGHIIPGSTLSRTIETYTYQAKQGE